MPLALIAGQGRLPELLLAELRRRAEPVVLAQLEGSEGEGVHDALAFRLETLGGLVLTLAEAGVDRVCLAGSIRRPPAVDPALIDAQTRPLVPRLLAALDEGDDAALRTVLSIFEEAGIAIVAPQDLMPGLLAGPGVATRAEPDARARADAERAERIVAAMGVADVGQSCVVARGQALAIEGQAGTDWMLRALALMQADGIDLPRPPSASGGILFKAPKPGQDRRVDCPAVGPDTVSLAADIGLAGLVIAAEGVILLDREALIERAEDAGLFVWAR